MSIAQEQLNNLKNEALNCNACSLCETRNKLVFSDGSETAQVMFIGEAPGKNEDDTGIPFIGRAGQLLRKFMFEHVYHEKGGNTENERADRLLETLFNKFYANPELMPKFFVSLLDQYDKTTVVCDYLASMSDTYAINLFNDMFVPQRWIVL